MNPQSISRIAPLVFAFTCIPPAAEAQKDRCIPETGSVQQAVTEDRFEVRNIEGWLIDTNRDVIKEHPELMAKTFEHLKWDLYQTKLAVPTTAVGSMQEHTPIWIEYDEDVSFSYHPEPDWLLQRGYKIPRDPDSMMSLSAKGNYGDSYRRPFVIYHELVHGHDHVFIGKGRGYGNAECEANYQRMMRSGINEKAKTGAAGPARITPAATAWNTLRKSSEAYFPWNHRRANDVESRPFAGGSPSSLRIISIANIHHTGTSLPTQQF